MRLSGILFLFVFCLGGLYCIHAQIPNEWQIVPTYGSKNTTFSKYCGSDNIIIEEKKADLK